VVARLWAGRDGQVERKVVDVLGVQRVAAVHPTSKAAAGDGGGSEGVGEARIEKVRGAAMHPCMRAKGMKVAHRGGGGRGAGDAAGSSHTARQQSIGRRWWW
jgi:hypothetical protein